MEKIMDSNGDKNFLNAQELSSYFRIPLNTIYRLTKCGKIKGVKVGKQWRYSKADIERILSGEVDLRSFDIHNSSKYEEKRAYPRMNCNFSCGYRTNIPSQNDFISYGFIRNVSGGGVFLYDAHANLDHIRVDDPIDLIIDFKSDTNNSGTVLDTKGRVVRKTSDGVGIKFRNIKEEYKNLITQYVG